MKLAIIGTAGRKEDKEKLSLEKWNEMKRVVFRFIKEQENLVAVMSGGAAWVDHLAVGLYNAGLVPDLYLFLPCEFDYKKVQYTDNGDRDWRRNPGSISNYYHKIFSEKVNISSLTEINKAIYKGAAVIVGKGFFDRNNKVAEADKLIAFTFGNEAIVKDGGTAHTVKAFLARQPSENAYHCDLNSMILYQNAKIK